MGPLDANAAKQGAVNRRTAAVITKDNVNDGPAPARTKCPRASRSPAAAVPTVAKIPAPIIAPMPIRVTLRGPSVRLSESCGPPIDARMSSRFFVRKIPRSKLCLPNFEFEAGLAVVEKERAECKVSSFKFQAF